MYLVNAAAIPIAVVLLLQSLDLQVPCFGPSLCRCLAHPALLLVAAAPVLLLARD